jgi:alpha-tubulin suppressor-like RCC1 family protein
VTDCVQITGGANHTCVVHSDGTVSRWGSNASGQVGQPMATTPVLCAESSGPSVPCITSPVKVPGLIDVAEVRAGEQHTCARTKTDMTVYCWGENSDGQLGDGTNTSRSVPAAVIGVGTDIVELSVGRWFSCARHQAGSVSCWGGNSGGQLGNGSTTNSNRPVKQRASQTQASWRWAFSTPARSAARARQATGGTAGR